LARTRRLAVCGAALGLTLATAFAESHTFTDSNGKTFSGDVIGVKNGEADIKRDGKVFRMDIADFSAADQTYLHEWKAPDATKDAPATTDSDIQVAVSFDKIGLSAGTAAGPVMLQPKVLLTNKEETLNFTGLKGTLIMVGVETKSPGRYKVMAVETFNCKLEAQRTFQFNGKVRPETERAAAGQGDFQFKSWILVLENADGNIIQFHHSGAALKSADEALKLKVGEVLDANLHPVTKTGARPATTPPRPGARSAQIRIPAN
jgi:hypothetical protein